MIWHVTVHVTWRFHGNHILTGMFFFQNFNFSYFKIKQKVSCRSFCGVFIPLLLTRFSTILWGFRQIQESKMADQDGRHSEMITQLWRHHIMMRTSKETFFRRTIYPPSLVGITFIFSELRRNPPGQKTKKRPVKIGLLEDFTHLYDPSPTYSWISWSPLEYTCHNHLTNLYLIF